MELVPEDETEPVDPDGVSESNDEQSVNNIDAVANIPAVPDVHLKVAQNKVTSTKWYKLFQCIDPVFYITWLVTFSLLLIGFYFFFQHNQRVLDAHLSEIEVGNREVREKIAEGRSVASIETVSMDEIPDLQVEVAIPVQLQSVATTETLTETSASNATLNQSAPANGSSDLLKLLEEKTQQLEYLAAENHELRLLLEFGEGTLPVDDVFVTDLNTVPATNSGARGAITSEADESVEEQVQVRKEDSDTLIVKAQIAFEEKRYDSATALYNEALQIAPQNREVNLGVAATAFATGNTALAIDRYRHLLTLNPDDQQVFRLMLGMSKEDEMVEAELRGHVLQRADEQSTLFSIMGQYFGVINEWSIAEDYFTDAYNSLEAGQPQADILFNLGVSLEHLGRSQKAQEHYLRALNSDGPANFNRSLLQERVQLLEQSLSQ